MDLATEMTPERIDADITATIVQFINKIGIPCRVKPLPHQTFLPGIDISGGTIYYDAQRMPYPGDLLHEAGHIAILKPEYRSVATGPDNLFGDMNRDAAEMAAIAWSWAALKYLRIAPEIVFHEHGYKGGSSTILENFSNNKFFGVPVLQRFGMTRDITGTVSTGEQVFPAMKHWLRP